MTDKPIDDGADWGSFSPEQLHALSGLSESFAVARRLVSTVATNAESDDGGDSLGRLLAEVASGDPVSVALAASVECVRLAQELYGEHTGAVLALRAQRQLDVAARNREQFGA